MTDRLVTRGFVGRPSAAQRGQRVPPGQYLTNDFPVLSAGPTPHTPLAEWTLRVEGLVAQPVTWTWDDAGAPTAATERRWERCAPTA